MRDLPAGVVTLLFTDIEGSTRLLQALGDRYPAVLTRTRALLRSAFADFAGHEVDSQGDAFFVVFERASDAVSAAVAAQRNLRAEPWFVAAPDLPHDGSELVRVRMGIHTGEPSLGAEGYAGLDVHRAARISAVAHGGQVLLSQATLDRLRGQDLTGADYCDLGEYTLRDLFEPEHLYQLAAAGLRTDFPPLQAVAVAATNLPIPPTPLVGRDREVVSLCELLRREDVRLATVTGPGGAGKTRLALEVAAKSRPSFRDGVCLVALAPIGDPALLATAIAQTLGVGPAGGQPLEQSLTSFLAGKQVLLLLDNFEQIVPGRDLLARLLASCPGLKLLVTSRAPLRLSAEHELPLASLALPPRGSDQQSLEQIRQYPAVALLEQRARAVRSDFAVTSENARALVMICTRLDGLPLAIELAAARLKLFSPEALLGRLDHRLSVLTGGARDLPVRQQTLRDTIAWSYNLLTEAEQQLFRRLSVFVSGATLEAIEAVTSNEQPATSNEVRTGGADSRPTDDESRVTTPDTFEVVASLVDQSLLRADVDASGATRFRMLETINEYAAEELSLHGETRELQARHARYFVALAEEAERTLMSPAERGPWLVRLDAEQHNLRAAVRWSIDQNEASATDLGLRLVGSIWLWLRRERMAEGLRWAEELLFLPSAISATAARAKALFVAGELAWAEEHFSRAHGRLVESVELWRALGDRRWLAFSLAHLARVTLNAGEPPSDAERLRVAQALGAESVAIARTLGDRWILAWTLIRLADISGRTDEEAATRALAEEGAALARSLGDRWLLARPIYLLGRTAFVHGDWQTAREHLEEALPARRDANDKLNVSYVLALLSDIALRQGETERALALVAEGLRIAWEIDNRMTIAHDLSLLAQLSQLTHEPVPATRLLAAAEQIRERWHAVLIPPTLVEHGKLLGVLGAQLDEPGRAAAWAEGKAMSVAEAVHAGLEAAETLHSSSDVV